MDWLDVLSELARLSGAAALRHFGKNLSVNLKADGSPVTAADLAAESAARRWITQRFPQDAILGEEEGATGAPSAARQWLIDPIDGTKSFIRGVPLWGTMIGLKERGSVIAGSIYCPALNEIVVAAQEHGCWYNGTRTRVSAISDLGLATVLTSDSRFGDNPTRQSGWATLARRAAVARTWGDCYGYLLLASGRAEIMLDDRLNLWDYCPLEPIVREAGGVLTDWRGQAAFGGDAIATNAALASRVRELLLEPAAAKPA